ncbi:arginyltransferase [Methylomicrobium album]|uniref:Aspartate/glutamate leucyltransferase n=1 Tax=Methylomicrobium album BG8 TaxID=686340 RepID=H8GQC3_METAL|nr:arginyltransferase [Methylomicrobium album]EIC28582.1 putative arginyl-tRNA:protein arginylyltransferase [Methylomicrobium album BG8]
MTSIPLFITGDHSCSYLDRETARSAFVHPAFRITPAIYAELLKHGFRRSGNDVYTPQCPQCSACIPVRIPVARFKPNRQQKRCRKKNADTRVVIKPAVFEPAHYDMYLRYQNSRHPDGSMARTGPEDYIDFLGSEWCDTLFAEFSIAGELAAVAVIDRFTHAWSAVYTFFDPKFNAFSPGMYAVLWQIEEARKQQSEFLYLGYWIKNCRKMVYKSAYQPLQLYIEQEWREFSDYEEAGAT